MQFGVEYGERAAGEDGVAAPGSEQLALARGFLGVQAPHSAHDEAGGDVFVLLAAGEGGVGDLGVGDHLAGVSGSTKASG